MAKASHSEFEIWARHISSGKSLKMSRFLMLAAFTALLACAFSQNPAPACTDEIRDGTCKLPNCRCSGQDIPGALAPADTPQLVFLTFDDAVSIDNFPFYEEVLFNRKNPNNQSITASFFITHEYTNYSQVHELWRKGHDIALHSITHNPSTLYWRNLTAAQWRQEVVEQREQMAFFARVPASEIKGMRAPFLQTGGDTMYNVLKQANFAWECSRPTLNFRRPGLWPYTNDYLSSQDCQIAPCPVGEYKGFWTVPMIDMLGGNNQGCAMVDACIPVPGTEQDTYDLLYKNFQDHYTGNRAPYGIFTHAAWLNGTEEGEEFIRQRRLGYIKFLDYLDSLPDVYIVSITRALEWIKTPTPLANVSAFPAFQVSEKPSNCPRTQSCRFAPEQTPFPTERWLHSCSPCPAVYPWLGNPLGRAPY